MSPDVTFGLDTGMSYTNGEPCARTTATGDAVYFSQYMDDDAMEAAYLNHPADLAMLQLIVEHEVFHVLGAADLGNNNGGTIMTQYPGLTNACITEAYNANYPSGGPTSADFTTVTPCANGTGVGDVVIASGTDDQKDWYQEPYSGDCHWVLEIPVYGSWAEGDDTSVTVHGYVDHYEWLDVGGSCSGPPPY
jgi:hypothetical protein